MKVKFFKTKQVADPKSTEFVRGIQDILKEHGITDQRGLNECSRKIFQSNIVLMNHVKRFILIQSLDKDDDTDTLLKRETDNMKAILSSYGLANEEKQEEIILGYFALLGELAGNVK